MSNDDKNKYVIRPYLNGDETSIIELMKLIYGSWKSAPYWQWKYKENTAGFYNDLITLAISKNKLAGHYTIIPTRILVDRNEVIFAQSVDTATNPEFRRMGIFEATANATFESAVDHQIPITYGVANVGPSYYGFIKKLQWSHVFFLSHHVRIINSDKIFDRYTKNKFLLSLGKLALKLIQFKGPTKKVNNLEFDQVDYFPKEIDGFSSNIAKEYKFLVKKDQTYLNYRIMNPDAKYDVYLARENGAIVGYAIITVSSKSFKKIKLDKMAIITELIALKGKDNVISMILNYLTSVYKKQNVDAIACSLPNSHRYCKILRKQGFLKLKSQMGFIVRENYKHPLINSLDILDEKNWHITHLDTDHV